MFDHPELIQRLIQLEALSLVLDKITGEVFDKNVEGDWSKVVFPLAEAQREALQLNGKGSTAARVDLVAAHMFAELSAASDWFAEQARDHAERANEQIVEDIARGMR